MVAEIGAVAADGTALVIKSTVPPGTTASLRVSRPDGAALPPVVACPEFLREGSALADLRHAARIAIGGDDLDALQRVGRLFEPLNTKII